MCRIAGMVGVKAKIGRQFGMAARVGCHAEGAGCFQRIDDMQIMGKAFGEVLPGVGGCIGGDEMLLPVGWRALLVIAASASV